MRRKAGRTRWSWRGLQYIPDINPMAAITRVGLGNRFRVVVILPFTTPRIAAEVR